VQLRSTLTFCHLIPADKIEKDGAVSGVHFLSELGSTPAFQVSVAVVLSFAMTDGAAMAPRAGHSRSRATIIAVADKCLRSDICS
jgi:hypothetical protein